MATALANIWVTALSLAPQFTCAVTAESGVKCWCDNQVGELGDGTTVSCTLPAEL